MLKKLLLTSMFAFAMVATTGCYETNAAVKSAGKCGAGMKGKCGTGKCGAKLKDKGMKCGTGKCGSAKGTSES